MAISLPNHTVSRRWVLFAILLGLYLSMRGYHSREGDQAYRLPILLHQQHPSLFASDPFVRAFDTFNPHRGYFALIDAASRALGLSAALALLFVVTYAVACVGLDRLTRSAWPDAGPWVGLAAVGLVLLARAGNVGTNHLFEPMLLDRGMAFALGWLGLALAVSCPERGCWFAALALALAALIHPAVGLQLALLVGTGWVVWGFLSKATGVRPRIALQGAAMVALAIVPAFWLYAGQSGRLFEGLPTEKFRLLVAYVQSPQHMVPHLWRWPQWLAWACYFVLAGL